MIPAADGGVEPAAIERLAEAGPNAFKTVLEMFCERADAMADRLARSVASGDRAETARSAHDLAATGALVGGYRLAQLAGWLEEAADSGDELDTRVSDDIAVELELVVTSLQLVLAELGDQSVTSSR